MDNLTITKRKRLTLNASRKKGKNRRNLAEYYRCLKLRIPYTSKKNQLSALQLPTEESEISIGNSEEMEIPTINDPNCSFWNLNSDEHAQIQKELIIKEEEEKVEKSNLSEQLPLIPEASISRTSSTISTNSSNKKRYRILLQSKALLIKQYKHKLSVYKSNIRKLQQINRRQRRQIALMKTETKCANNAMITLDQVVIKPEMNTDSADDCTENNINPLVMCDTQFGADESFKESNFQLNLNRNLDVIKTEIIDSDPLENESQFNLENDLIERDVPSNSNLDSSKVAEENTKENECRACNSVFSSYMQLLIHYRVKKHKDLKESCIVCSKEFDSIYMHTHIRFHSKCGLCEKPFKANTNKLIEHVQKHKKKLLGFQCEICGTTFVLSTYLRQHVSRLGNQRYDCDFCDRSFHYFSALEAHKRLHTGEKPYSCTMCPTSYEQTTQLKVHMRRHTERKQYTCTICKRTFIYQVLFNRHMRIHTGKMPYSCTRCNETFKNNDCLQEHYNIHNADNPFVVNHLKKIVV